MKIDLIKNNYPSGALTKLKHGNTLERDRNESAGVCEDKKSVNRGYYGGSFTGIKPEAAANSFENLGKTFFDKICRSKSFQWGNALFEDQSVIGQALVALVVAGGLRPATNLAMAGKQDKEDSIYAASHAIASALIGFIVSSIVMAPFGSAFKRIKDNPKKYLEGLEKLFGVEEIGPRKLGKSLSYKKLSKIAQFAVDTLVLGIPKAMMTIALIPPILKYVFHIEKGKKKEQTEVKQSPNTDYSKKQINNPAFQSVTGGTK